MLLISLVYLFLILVYLVIGAAIVFHMLYYKINRRFAAIMCLVYLGGGIFLLIFNISLFFSVNWYQIITNTGL